MLRFISRVVKRLLQEYQNGGVKAVASLLRKTPSVWRRGKAYKTMLALPSNKEKFSEIHSKNLWRSTESVSGLGSEEHSTENIRSWLCENISTYGISSVTDAPCGDFNWMRLVLEVVDIQYLGLDIVDEVIARNKRLFETESIKFETFDLCAGEIPDTDLIICRDCLFHLSYSDINDVLHNLSRSRYKYLLTTTHLRDGTFNNHDIVSGDFRYIDLFAFPFNFSNESVLAAIPDNSPESTVARSMILIAKQDVPANVIF